MRSRRLAAVLVFLSASFLWAEAPGIYAITGGTVHPVSGPDIPGGTVIVRGGLIEAVGRSLPIPSDAMVVDVTGSHVYPGLIDAHTSLGFAAPKESEKREEPSADDLAIRSLTLSEEDLEARRAAGVTTIVTAPSSGIFNGQSAIVTLGSGPLESRVIKSPAALQISFNTRPMWTYPDSLMGVVSYIRQSFLDAQQHAVAREIYDRNPAGLRRPEDDASLEALGPAMRREMPVVFVADSAQMIRRAQAIARELDLRLIVAGAGQAHGMTAELAGIPLLVSVKWPVAPADREDQLEQPLRVIRERQLAPTTPAALARAGATFALVSGAGKTGDFLPGIRTAIERGLSPEDALRATTLVPARIFGVDRQLGSLERGKIANVIVTDKPLFEKESNVTRVFVDGREIRVTKPEQKDEAAAGTTASVVDGTWALTVRAPQGNVNIQVTLRAEEGRLSGTYSGDGGSGDIRGGTIDGNAIAFTISANAQSEAEASDWAFRGTVDGDAMSGTVTTTLGSFEFSGSRSK